ARRSSNCGSAIRTGPLVYISSTREATASAAENWRPVHRSSLARLRPTSRASRSVPPPELGLVIAEVLDRAAFLAGPRAAGYRGIHRRRRRPRRRGVRPRSGEQRRRAG